MAKSTNMLFKPETASHTSHTNKSDNYDEVIKDQEGSKNENDMSKTPHNSDLRQISQQHGNNINENATSGTLRNSYERPIQAQDNNLIKITDHNLIQDRSDEQSEVQVIEQNIYSSNSNTQKNKMNEMNDALDDSFINQSENAQNGENINQSNQVKQISIQCSSDKPSNFELLKGNENNSASLLERPLKSSASLINQTINLNDNMEKSQVVKQEQLLLPLNQKVASSRKDDTSCMTQQKVREHAISQKKSGSASLLTDQSLQQILKSNSPVFQKDLLEITSGTMKVNYKNSINKPIGQEFKDFIKSEIDSPESSEEEDQEEVEDEDEVEVEEQEDQEEEEQYQHSSCINPTKVCHQNRAKILKDILRYRPGSMDFNWSGNQDYYQFLDDENEQHMNSPKERGKALWGFLFNSLGQKKQFEKLKVSIEKANNLPETQELLIKKKALNDYLRKQAQNIQGNTSVMFEETLPKSPNESLVMSQKSDFEFTTTQRQIISMPQMDSMKYEINKLFRMKKIDEQEFTKLKQMIGYKHPIEKQNERILQYRKDQALSKLMTSMKKSFRMKKDKLSPQQQKMEKDKMQDLMRQEQLLTIKEKAKPQVDHKWNKNPFYSYRELLRDQGSDKDNINYIVQNIMKCHVNRAKNTSHSQTIQVDQTQNIGLSTLTIKMTSSQGSRNYNRQNQKSPNNNSVRSSQIKKSGTLTPDLEQVELKNQNKNWNNADMGLDLIQNKFLNKPKQGNKNASFFSHETRRNNIINISPKSMSSPKASKNTYNSPESKHSNTINKFKNVMSTLQNNFEQEQKRRKYAVELSNDAHYKDLKNQAEYNHIPLELIQLLQKVFTNYTDLTNSRLDQLKEKIMEIRFQEIALKECDENERLSTEYVDKVSFSDFEYGMRGKIDSNEALAQQLDYQFWNKTYQQLGIVAKNEELSNEVAKYIIANLAKIVNPYLAKKLKSELNQVVQRYILLRSIVQILQNSLSQKQKNQLNQRGNIDKYGSARQNLQQQQDELTQSQINLNIQSSHLDFKIESFKILLDPKYYTRIQTKKKKGISMASYVEKFVAQDASIMKQMQEVVHPCVKSLLKFCSTKVQQDRSFQLIMLKKLARCSYDLNQMLQNQNIEVETQRQEAPSLKIPKLNIPDNAQHIQIHQLDFKTISSRQNKTLNSANNFNTTAFFGAKQQSSDDRTNPQLIESPKLGLYSDLKVHQEKQDYDQTISFQRAQTQTQNQSQLNNDSR